MLVPITVIAAIVLVVRTDWLERYGIALSIVSVIAMSSIFLTMQAGGALESALHLHGEAAHLIDQHSEAAKILAILYVLFTATVIVAFAAAASPAGALPGWRSSTASSRRPSSCRAPDPRRRPRDRLGGDGVPDRGPRLEGGLARQAGSAEPLRGVGPGRPLPAGGPARQRQADAPVGVFDALAVRGEERGFHRLRAAARADFFVERDLALQPGADSGEG